MTPDRPLAREAAHQARRRRVALWDELLPEPPAEPWPFRDHRDMSEVMQEEGDA